MLGRKLERACHDIDLDKKKLVQILLRYKQDYVWQSCKPCPITPSVHSIFFSPAEHRNFLARTHPFTCQTINLLVERRSGNTGRRHAAARRHRWRHVFLCFFFFSRFSFSTFPKFDFRYNTHFDFASIT